MFQPQFDMLKPISIQCKMLRDWLFAITFFWNVCGQLIRSVAFYCMYFKSQSRDILHW
jgi:hypothetical protein